MKELKTSLRELRTYMKYTPSEIHSQVYFLMRCKIDYDVFLPTKGRNLQRDFCWTLLQKREIIMSILMERHIPHISLISCVTDAVDSEYYQVIDGKQRLSSIIDFVNGKFTIELEGQEFLFSELPIEYQRGIVHRPIKIYMVNDGFTNKMTDEEKISWFKFVNFAGTPQDVEYMNNL